MSEDFLSGYDEKQIKSSLKLQELVKERVEIIKHNKKAAVKNHELYLEDVMKINIELLESLVEESEK